MTPDEKVAWVERFFETDASGFCGECPHFQSWKEPHGERLTDCALLQNGRVDLCPALQTELYGHNESTTIVIDNSPGGFQALMEEAKDVEDEK